MSGTKLLAWKRCFLAIGIALSAALLWVGGLSAAPGKLQGTILIYARDVGYCGQTSGVSSTLSTVRLMLQDNIGVTSTAVVTYYETYIWTVDASRGPFTLTVVPRYDYEPAYQVGIQKGIQMSNAGSILVNLNVGLLEPCTHASPETTLTQVPGPNAETTITVANQSPAAVPISFGTSPALPLVAETFETTTTLPVSWTATSQGGSGQEWMISSMIYAIRPGIGKAATFLPAGGTENKWLLTPPFRSPSGVLAFWSAANVEFCKVNNTCDLSVWLVRNEIGGGDDVLLGTVDNFWTSSYVYTRTAYTLTSYLNPTETVRVGFQYTGTAGWVGIDNVMINQEPLGVQTVVTVSPASTVIPPYTTETIRLRTAAYRSVPGTAAVPDLFLHIHTMDQKNGIVVVPLHFMPAYGVFLPLTMKNQ